jgi:dihydroorotate dehydrogenase
MKLRGINFGHVLDGSGARSWFGDGYPFHHWVPGLSFEGSTFVAKTTTLEPRPGNANMRRGGWVPRIFVQRAVKVNWSRGVVLNALGLPGPGVKALLATRRWQTRSDPFFLSFMAIEQTPSESVREVRRFVRLLKDALPHFAAPVGLQVNFSCPNVHPREHVTNFWNHLDEYQALGIPIMPKFSATLPIEEALVIEQHPGCDAICVSNSIPWGELRDRIDWEKLFGQESPLRKFGGGGLSGAPLLRIVADWVRRARSEGLKKPINAGGGILGPSDVDVLFNAGASSVFVGSIAMLRGWRLHRTIEHAARVFSARESKETERSPALVAAPLRRRA